MTLGLCNTALEPTPSIYEQSFVLEDSQLGLHRLVVDAQLGHQRTYSGHQSAESSPQDLSSEMFGHLLDSG
ncbi:MAG: hypothetical protein L7T84_12985 [Akkermansiaceae bacterium]|nr:hypothetical protein [Akkermansiaceae bacterium]